MKKSNLKFVNLYGGLANQLFQYTYALWLEQNGHKVSLLEGFNYIKFLKRPHVENICDTHKLILPITKLKKQKALSLYVYDFLRRKIGLTEEDINPYSNNHKYHIGYFQNIKFWDELSEDRKNAVVSPFRSKQIFPNNIAFIHMRFGDYLNLSTMKVMSNISEKYFIEAIEMPELNHVKEFHVFSDDEHKAEKLIRILKMKTEKEINFYRTENALQALSKMSAYQTAIIPNSTFSWWGCNVGNCKLKVMPRNWYKKKSALLYDKNSIVI